MRYPLSLRGLSEISNYQWERIIYSEMRQLGDIFFILLSIPCFSTILRLSLVISMPTPNGQVSLGSL